MAKNKIKILLFGGSGKLGTAIQKYRSSNLEIFAPSHKECDISKLNQVKKSYILYKPNIIINSAALVGTKECERNKNLAWKVNVEGTKNITQVCSKNKTRLISISTSAIFDGIKGNYKETDNPNPTFYYAVTKVVAEQVVSTLSNYVIVRLDFFPIKKLKYSQVLFDHYTSKIPVNEAAKKIIKLSISNYKGIINIGRKKESLYNILKPYFPNITPIKTSESDLPNFPKDLSLNLLLWKKNFG